MKTVKISGSIGSGKSLALRAISTELTALGRSVVSFTGEPTLAAIMRELGGKTVDAVLLDEVSAELTEDIIGAIEATQPDCTVYYTASGREIEAKVERLDIQPGNFVLMRVEQRATPESIQTLVDQVQRLVPAGCTVAVVVGDNDITTLPDAQMREAGWVRADALEAMERLLKWYDDVHGDNCDYTGDHPLAVAKATVERIKGGN